MLSFLRCWREAGWEVISAETYADIWQQFGGSVMTHPDIVAQLSAMTGISVRYLGKRQPVGPWQAAIATWGRHLALSRSGLKAFGKKRAFDLGNAEVILPIAPEMRFKTRFKMAYVNAQQASQILNLRRQTESLALARPPEDYSSKFLYNQRREWRLFQEAGGRAEPVGAFSTTEIARMYTELFEARWGFDVPSKKTLSDVLQRLQPFLKGQVLFLDEAPVAVQILYQVESPNWLSLEYINGGVAPDHKKFSPGSVLTFLNTQSAWEEARAKQKNLRYSFGRADREYKLRWCQREPVCST